MTRRTVFVIITILVSGALFLRSAAAGSYREEKKEAEAFARGLILARKAVSEVLSKKGGEIREGDFVRTYGSVYGKIQEIRKKKGYIVTFSSLRPRNPRDAATPFDARLISRFRRDRDFKRFWTVTMVQGRSYSRLVMPVFAGKSCLLCHGPKEKRPAFIAKRYPQDRSIGFKEGEIMGLISLYMPDEE